MPAQSEVPLQLLTVIWPLDGSDPIVHTDQVHDIAEYPSAKAYVVQHHENTIEEYTHTRVQTSLWQLKDVENPTQGYELIYLEGNPPEDTVDLDAA